MWWRSGLSLWRCSWRVSGKETTDFRWRRESTRGLRLRERPSLGDQLESRDVRDHGLRASPRPATLTSWWLAIGPELSQISAERWGRWWPATPCSQVLRRPLRRWGSSESDLFAAALKESLRVAAGRYRVPPRGRWPGDRGWAGDRAATRWFVGPDLNL